MRRRFAGGLDFRIIPAGFNASPEFLRGLLFGFFLDLAFYDGQEYGFHVVWIDKHRLESILCSQNDGAGINAFNCKYSPTFYVFEHVACFNHGISSLGNRCKSGLSRSRQPCPNPCFLNPFTSIGSYQRPLGPDFFGDAFLDGKTIGSFVG